MKALVCESFGPIENLRVADVPRPTPGPGEVRVDVHASSLNFPDALIVQGLYQVKPKLPFSPGAEVAGVVDAVGDGVTRVKVGDRVFGFTLFGALAEACILAESNVLPIPAAMSYEHAAAFLLTYSTTLHALGDLAHLRQGETLLVLGAGGGVGTAAIEIGKALGARVIAAASSAAKVELARELGADATIRYDEENLRERITALTGGRGVEVVYDPVGGAMAELALRSLAWRGRYLVVGFASGEIPKIPLNLALLVERSIIGVHWGASLEKDPREQERNLATLLRWFDEGRVKPVVRETVPLDEAASAIARLHRRAVVGKVVVTPRRSA